MSNKENQEKHYESIMTLKATLDYLSPIYHATRALMEPNEKLVDFHIRKLGKQTKISNYIFRTYIWNFDDFQLSMSNKEGRTIEVLYPASEEKAIQAFKNYLNLMGINKDLDIIREKYITQMKANT